MRLLIAHGDLEAGGGAEAYARAIAAMLERMGHAPDLIDIHGLRSGGRYHDWLVLRLGRLPVLQRFHLWKYALVCRLLPRLARGYDGVILSYGEGPALGAPTLVFHHAPALFSTARDHLEALGAAGRGRPHLQLRRLYTRLMRGVAAVHACGGGTMRVANSRWTADRLPGDGPRENVIYPRVVPPPQLGARRSRLRIVMLGRMARNKRIDEGIAIVERLREEGLPAELDVVGRATDRHGRRLMRRCAGREWLRFHPDATPQALAALLARARFGLHCYRHEHFGISVAEMICAGLLPVVYAGGGVCELVPLPELQFGDSDQAVERLAALMTRPEDDVDALWRRLRQGSALGAALDFEARLEPVLGRFLEACG